MCLMIVAMFVRMMNSYEFVFCVLFVRQKTAYEMRISDWSSDVCSSDLPLALQRFRHLAIDDALRETFGDRGLADAGFADQRRIVLGAEIGRASCRDRVAQYV